MRRQGIEDVKDARPLCPAIASRLAGEIKGARQITDPPYIHSIYSRGEVGQVSNPEQNESVKEAAGPSHNLLPAGLIPRNRFWPVLSITTKHASNSSTDQGGGKRRGVSRDKIDSAPSGATLTVAATANRLYPLGSRLDGIRRRLMAYRNSSGSLAIFATIRRASSRGSCRVSGFMPDIIRTARPDLNPAGWRITRQGEHEQGEGRPVRIYRYYSREAESR